MGELTEKGILHREDGFYVVRQAMPYPLKYNNAFLIESNDGWVVIDVGIDLPETRRVWEMVAGEIGISLKQVNRIYITHCHPDHLGAARWLQQACDSPVFMLDEEIARAEKFIFIEDDFEAVYSEAISGECRRHGFPEHLQKALVKDWQYEVTPLFRRPLELFPVHLHDVIELGGKPFRLIKAPGHADGQILFYGAERGLLFSADVLASGAYLHCTDWPNTFLENPMADVLKTLDELDSLPLTMTWPGHGPALTDLHGAIEGLRQRHRHKLDRVLKAVNRPITAGELYPRINRIPLDYIHLHRVLIGETLGYLLYLASRGALEMHDDGDKVFFLPRGN